MPLWKKGDTKAYNLWRKNYRKKKHDAGFCNRCYRPLIADSNTKVCPCCMEANTQNKKLNANFY